MSSHHAGNGGGMGNNNYGLPKGVTQQQLDEIKLFNASLTQAGNKPRPPRSRGSGLNRGRGSGISSGRWAGSAGAVNAPRSGSGIAYGAVSNYSVGPSTPSPIERSNLRDRVPIHLRGVADMQKTRWVDLDGISTGTLGAHTICPPTFVVATPHRPRSRSPTRSSILVTNAAQTPQIDISVGQRITAQILQEIRAAHNIAPSGCQHIVTNMTPDDPTKPFIPAHLHQTSCRVAIQEIADMTNIPLSQVTSDGTSILASRPINPAENSSNTGIIATTPFSTPREPAVGRKNWLGNSGNKKPDTATNVVVGTPNLQAMSSEPRCVSMAGATIPQNAFAAKSSAPAASTSTHARAESYSAMEVEMTGAPSLLDTPVESFSSDPINEALTAMPKLADSRWATIQPSENSYTIDEYGWPNPSVSSFPFDRPSESVTPAFSEVAPGSESGFSNQPKTGSTWEVLVNDPLSAAPLQSKKFRGCNSGQNDPVVCERITASPGGRMQPHMPDNRRYGPPPPRNLAHNHSRPVPSWSNENIQHAQPSSQPKQEEKVKYLKDSMWAC